MSALDTVAGLTAGTFLISVALHGNSQALIAQAKKDKGFLKWAIAVSITLYAYKLPDTKGIVTMVISIAFLALFIKNGDKISEQAKIFWDML